MYARSMLHAIKPMLHLLLTGWCFSATFAEACITDNELLEIGKSGIAHLCYQRNSAAYAGLEQFNIRIYNFEESYDMYFDNRSPGGVFSGYAPLGGTFETLTYATHRFFVKPSKTSTVKKTVTMDPEQDQIIWGTVPEGHALYEKYKEASRKVEEAKAYYKKAGRKWIGFPSRSPPTMPFVGEKLSLGEIMTSQSDYGYWTCPFAASSCETQPVHFKMQLVSTHPRVLVVKGLFSSTEADAVMDMATPQLHRGTVGNGGRAFTSNTRTSELAFLSYTDGAMTHILHRFGDVLGIPFWKIKPRSEPLQVVRYKLRQEYSPHLDAGSQSADSRFLTLLTVFHPAERGGCTSFPRAYAKKGLEVCLGKGDAVLFYSLLPDGNMDADAVHAGDQVLEGTKWIGNIWVHDSPHQDQHDTDPVEL